MLIDDNEDDNFFHERTIKKHDVANTILIHTSALSALDYLKSKDNDKDTHPDLIFLDINMPHMNGWEFLEEYNNIKKELQSQAIVIMLTTSENPDDKIRAKSWDFVSNYVTKPLTEELIDTLIKEHFKNE